MFPRVRVAILLSYCVVFLQATMTFAMQADACVPAVPGERYALSFPVGVASDQRIAPGAVGDFAFTLRDIAGSHGDRTLSGALHVDEDVLDEYVFVSDDRRCRAPVFRVDAAYELAFAIDAMAPGETVTCRYRIERAATSRNDLKFDVCGDVASPYCGHAFRRGTLPDMALAASPVAPIRHGDRTAIVRLQLRNPTAHVVPFRDVTTTCREFEGSDDDAMPFRIDGDLPGGCPSVPGETCTNFSGQNASSHGFRLGPVPAGGVASCLVRLTLAEPLTGPVSTPLRMLGDDIRTADGTVRFDGDATNDAIVLGVEPSLPKTIVATSSGPKPPGMQSSDATELPHARTR